VSQQKRMFKVLGIVPKHSNPKESMWLRLGTAFVNRDDSINIYLDAMPRSFELQLREFEPDELRKRDATSPAAVAPIPFERTTPSTGATDSVPF